ncbi:MAG: hypothetical protein LBH92_02195 [Bacteroidales bacterium]|nr:hypothetical protein [Bacteroidales bacterium]
MSFPSKCLPDSSDKKYKFGDKVFILYAKRTKVIAGTLSLGNPYDEHTLEEALKQHERLYR